VVVGALVGGVVGVAVSGQALHSNGHACGIAECPHQLVFNLVQNSESVSP